MRGDTDADCEGASGQTLFARKCMAFYLLAQALATASAVLLTFTVNRGWTFAR